MTELPDPSAATMGELIFYRREDGNPAVEARLEDDSIWMTQGQVVDLFQSSKANISAHIADICNEGELDPESTVRDFRTVREEGSRRVQRTLTYYNLDLIISIAKNYLDEKELKRLNGLVPTYFEAAEYRAQNHEPTYMKDWIIHLDRIMTAMEAPTLVGAGKVSRQQAVARAEGEYAKYRSHIDTAPSKVEEAYLESIKQVQREVEAKQ
ncbi:MAG: RhuM family protein [Scrofimicrobium sp.]